MAENTTSPRRGADVQTAAVTEEAPVETTETVEAAARESAPELEPDDIRYNEVKGIRYLGTADSKQYSVEDLKLLGFAKADEPVEWTPAQRELPKKHFNAAALRAIVEQPDFEAF